MSEYLDYHEIVAKEKNLFKIKCPTCGANTLEIMECKKCGKAFCIKCKPEFFKFNVVDFTTEDGEDKILTPKEYQKNNYGDDDPSMDVTCECGETSLFV